jgi:hypothetical protein
VPSPPIWSASHPQNNRLAKALASSTDSIAAPCAAEIPRSVQNATRCPAGIAIGTQHKNPAAQSSACTTLGGKPRVRARRRAPAATMVAARLGGDGGCRNSASGTIAAATTTA